jgi:hypothetical protein
VRRRCRAAAWAWASQSACCTAMCRRTSTEGGVCARRSLLAVFRAWSRGTGAMVWIVERRKPQAIRSGRSSTSAYGRRTPACTCHRRQPNQMPPPTSQQVALRHRHSLCLGAAPVRAAGARVRADPSTPQRAWTLSSAASAGSSPSRAPCTPARRTNGRPTGLLHARAACVAPRAPACACVVPVHAVLCIRLASWADRPLRAAPRGQRGRCVLDRNSVAPRRLVSAAASRRRGRTPIARVLSPREPIAPCPPRPRIRATPSDAPRPPALAAQEQQHAAASHGPYGLLQVVEAWAEAG